MVRMMASTDAFDRRCATAELGRPSRNDEVDAGLLDGREHSVCLGPVDAHNRMDSMVERRGKLIESHPCDAGSGRGCAQVSVRRDFNHIEDRDFGRPRTTECCRHFDHPEEVSVVRDRDQHAAAERRRTSRLGPPRTEPRGRHFNAEA